MAFAQKVPEDLDWPESVLLRSISSATDKQPVAIDREVNEVSSGGKRVHVGESNRRILAGEDDVASWDDEELWRGRRRDKRGTFKGRDPSLVPVGVHRELNRRKFGEQAYEVSKDSVVEAVEYQVEVLRDPDADPALRMRAAENIIDRVLGKATERSQVEVSVNRSPWEEAIVAGLIGTDAQVIDVEPVEEDDESVEWHE